MMAWGGVGRDADDDTCCIQRIDNSEPPAKPAAAAFTERCGALHAGGPPRIPLDPLRHRRGCPLRRISFLHHTRERRTSCSAERALRRMDGATRAAPLQPAAHLVPLDPLRLLSAARRGAH